jgi:hypothetical protein
MRRWSVQGASGVAKNPVQAGSWLCHTTMPPVSSGTAWPRGATKKAPRSTGGPSPPV